MTANYEDLTDAQRKPYFEAARKLFDNPASNRRVKKLLMEIDPNIKYSDIEAEARTEEQLKERDNKIAELQASQMEEAATRRREAAHQRARERGLDPVEVEKTITEYKVADWDKAMDITDRLTHAAPASPDYLDNVHQMPDNKALWADPDKFAREEAHKTINEMLGNRRAQFAR